MRRGIPLSWLVPVLLLGIAAYAIAEDLTLTTYYPSPRGVYNELRTSGDVAIGTTAAPSARLHVIGAGGIQHPFRVEDTPETGGDLTPFEINSDGQVGIGTATPASGIKLHVVGIVRMDGLQLGTSATPGQVLTTNSVGVGTWQASSGAAPGTIVAWALVAGANGWTCYEGANCTGFSGPCVTATELWDPQNVMTLDAPASQGGTYFAVSGCQTVGPQVYRNGSCTNGYQYIAIPGKSFNSSQGEYGSTYYVCVKQ